jgi:two-component system sensor histidine kinase/response regulator
MNARVPILLVDDNPTKRLALKAALEPLGYSIAEAGSGREALRCVMANDFAVILLDVCMPIMDGFETAALIRQRQRSEMTPIIFITALGSDEIAETDLYTAGAVDFIFAPVPPDELRAKVSVFGNLFTKAEDLANRAREVQASADQLRFLTDAAPIGIFQTDRNDRYVYTNARWSEITGVPAEEAAGSKWGNTMFPKTPDGNRVGLADTDADESEIIHRIEIEVAGSTPRVVVLTSKAISDGAGGVTGRVGTIADITAEAAVETALSEARDKATEASRLKSDFLANMSHEIRTPMNGVIGMADLLIETNLDARQRDYAQTVRNSGEALLTIINDILDFSKVEVGKLEIEDIEFNLRGIVDDVVDLLSGPVQTKGLELVSIVENSVPVIVSGDPGRVRQVLTNLIANASKFTETGEIVIRVAVDEAAVDEAAVDEAAVDEAAVDEAAIDEGAVDDRVVRFSVSDTGVGIAAEKLAMVFQPFVQGDSSTSRRYGGTGLGLAISSQLVALMGGDCGVTSRIGEGSNFWFTIRVHADPAQDTYEQLSRDAGLDGVTALIVDDNATQRNVMSEYLTDWGMDVTTAASGDAALKAMRSAATRGEPFAVALLDRAMPDMDGLELTNAIVMEPALTSRLVLISALGEEEDLGSAADCGIFASVSKPLRREDLHTCLRVALGLQRADAGPAHVTAAWGAKPGNAGRLLLAEDNLINQKVAVAMLSTAGYRVDTVPDGAAAVRAAATQQYDAILMDCQMPELNGYEATAAIRANEGADRHTPIIAMTAGARREDRVRCLAAGMDSYVAKPVSKDALLALVARSVTRAPIASALPPLARHTAAAEMTIDPAVLDELRLLGRATEHDFVGELIDQFVHETDLRLVELRHALAVSDVVAVRRIAHAIKGSGGQVGGRRLALSCGRLERKAESGRVAEAQLDLREVEFDYRELRLALTQQVARRAYPALADETDAALPVLDAAIVDRLDRVGRAAGEDLLGRLTSLFLDDAAIHVADMRAGLAAADTGAVARAAHTLCGASGNMGASRLAGLCATLAANGNAGNLADGETLLTAAESELERVRDALRSLAPAS